MKKISVKTFVYFFMMLALAFGQACEGPEGPEGAPGPTGPVGPTGPAGPAGPSTTAKVLEFGVDFEVDDDGVYSYYLPFEALAEDGIEVNEADVVLLYMFRGAYPVNNVPVYIWSPMPQLIMTPQGNIQYNYIHTYLELFIYIDSQINLANLSAEARAELTEDQGFRLVIIPGELMNGRLGKPQLDYNNYDEVVKHFNIKDADIKKLKL